MTTEQVADKHSAELDKMGERGKVIGEALIRLSEYFYFHSVTGDEVELFLKMLREVKESTYN